MLCDALSDAMHMGLTRTRLQSIVSSLRRKTSILFQIKQNDIGAPSLGGVVLLWYARTGLLPPELGAGAHNGMCPAMSPRTRTQDWLTELDAKAGIAAAGGECACSAMARVCDCRAILYV